MTSKYEPLPSEPQGHQRPSVDSLPNDIVYSPPPLYDSLSPHSPYTPFAQDVEEDAPMRPRYRRTVDLPAHDSDPRFKMETPSPFTRAALIVLIIFLFWLALHLRKGIWMATGMGMEKQEIEAPVDLSY